MFLVCVRTVFSDTTSSRAISGPPRSVPSSRSTSSSRSLPLFGCPQEAFQEPGRLVYGALRALGRVAGQEHPGQGDVLELAQVAEVVVDGQTSLTGPAEGFTQLPLGDPHPCPQGRDRPHVGEEVTRIEALRLVEQVDCAARVSFSLAYPGHRVPPAMPVM